MFLIANPVLVGAVLSFGWRLHAEPAGLPPVSILHFVLLLFGLSLVTGPQSTQDIHKALQDRPTPSQIATASTLKAGWLVVVAVIFWAAS